MNVVRLIDRVVVPHVATILLRQTAKKTRLTSLRPYRFHRFPVNTSSLPPFSPPPLLPQSQVAGIFQMPSAEAIVSNILQMPSAYARMHFPKSFSAAWGALLPCSAIHTPMGTQPTSVG